MTKIGAVIRRWRSAYLAANPDVARERVDPLIHYVRHGRKEGRRPPWAPKSSVQGEKSPAFLSLASEAVTLERTAGVAFFERFGFSFDPANSAGKRVHEAVADLVSRPLNLRMERIEPDVSIIIPVYGQTHFVLGCLDSLTRQRSRFSVEVIVIDDASPAAAQTGSLGAIPWIRYKRREQNGGFIDSCNDAARIARGRFLVFLNSDTRIAAAWLDELIGSFELFPKAGLIGSKLLNEDGSLQEAGGIYWRDGSAWNYGLNDDPDHPKYCFARRVDYVSGAAIAIPTEIWRAMDGFDTSYRPAYCEDADLAFRLREAGYEVWLQPLSCVIHYEGKTHGRDLGAGGKAHQEPNMARFADRWKFKIASHRPNGEQPDQEANRAASDRILVIDAVTPMPDRDAGSVFTFRILQALSALGYQATFVPQHNYLYDRNYTSALQRLGIECLYSPLFRNVSDVLDFRSNFDIVLGCRFNVLGNLCDEIRRRMPAARILFENADLHYLREEREAALYGSRSKKIGAAITKAAELELIAKVDCTIVHTKVETEIIRTQLAVANVVEIPAVYEIQPTRVPFEDRYDIMFLGGFMHRPNIDAVTHFTSSVWPLLEDRLPEQARFVVVGSSAPPEIQALASDRIIVTGFVEDLRPYFDTARVFVAPLRYGAGIKGKVIQSLCHGTPAVMSTIAAEGIGLVPGREAIIADDDVDFAERVLMTYFDRLLWYSLQAAGYQFVESNYSMNRCLELITRALDTADATWLARHERALRSRLDRLISQAENGSTTDGR